MGAPDPEGFVRRCSLLLLTMVLACAPQGDRAPAALTLTLADSSEFITAVASTFKSVSVFTNTS